MKKKHFFSQNPFSSYFLKISFNKNIPDVLFLAISLEHIKLFISMSTIHCTVKVDL